jgi:hypothetical protein
MQSTMHLGLFFLVGVPGGYGNILPFDHVGSTSGKRPRSRSDTRARGRLPARPQVHQPEARIAASRTSHRGRDAPCRLAPAAGARRVYQTDQIADLATSMV